MNNKLTISVAVTVMAAFISLAGGHSLAATLVVPDPYLTIQDAVDAASPGDTIFVRNGTYNATTLNSTERPAHPGEWWFVTIDKSLNLVGESRDGVIIDGTGLQAENRCTGIWVSASNVMVKNLTIQNFTQTPATRACYGLYVIEKFRHYVWDEVATLDYVTAENVKATGNMYPLYFMKTEHATIENCVSENNLGDGIWVSWGSHNATVQGNTLTNAGDHGIWVGTSWMGQGHSSNNATITDNTVNGAREGGISFVSSDGATIAGNTITNVAGDGWSKGALSLKDGPSNVEAYNNTIYNNDGSWDGYNGTGHGVGIDGSPSNINLYCNSIYGNAGYGCYNYSAVLVMAENNWWGDTSGPGGVGPGTGDAVSDYVYYDPWIAGYSCSGFDPPMDKGAVRVKKNRVLPLKAVLLDENGYLLTDADISAPPVIQVMWNSATAGAAIDVTDDALSAGKGTEGNQFEFRDGKWQFNLKTKNYTAPGTYTVTMTSGDMCYVIESTCTATFKIE